VLRGRVSGRELRERGARARTANRVEVLTRGGAQEAGASSGREGKDLRGRVISDVAGDVMRRCRVEGMDWAEREDSQATESHLRSAKQAKRSMQCGEERRGQHLRFTASSGWREYITRSWRDQGMLEVLA